MSFFKLLVNAVARMTGYGILVGGCLGALFGSILFILLGAFWVFFMGAGLGFLYGGFSGLLLGPFIGLTLAITITLVRPQKKSQRFNLGVFILGMVATIYVFTTVVDDGFLPWLLPFIAPVAGFGVLWSTDRVLNWYFEEMGFDGYANKEKLKSRPKLSEEEIRYYQKHERKDFESKFQNLKDRREQKEPEHTDVQTITTGQK